MSTMECQRVATGEYLPVELLNEVRAARSSLAVLLWRETDLPRRYRRKIVKMLAMLDEVSELPSGGDDPFS